MPLPTGEIGGVKKKTLIIGGVAVGGLVIVVVYMRTKSAGSTANQGSVTDPAGNVCSALNPSSGYCPGTAEDLAYSQTALGTNAASYVGGQIIGYDGNGNPIYSSSSPVTGPGSYVNNAEWSQAALLYITQQEPSADPAVIANALGAYIEGAPVTATQKQIIEQAIAFQGSPPVPGPNGDPPNINESSAPPPVQSTKVSVPNVVGMDFGRAYNTITSDKLVSKPGHNMVNASYVVTSQSPKAGTMVNKGSTVTIVAPPPKTKPVVKKPGK